MLFDLLFFYSVALPQVSVILEVSENSRPVAQQRVELFAIHGDEADDPVSCITARNGRCSVNIPRQQDSAFIARTFYSDLQYLSEPFRGDTPPKVIPISVYPVVPGFKDLHYKERQILIRTSDEGVEVEEELVLFNAGRATVLGEGKATLEFNLPNSAHDLQFELGFAEQDTKIEGNTIQVNRPLSPGEWRFALRYKMESKRGSAHFVSSSRLPFESVYVALPNESVRLEDAKIISESWKVGSEGRFRIFEISPTSKDLAFKIEGLPWNLRLAAFLPLLGLILFVFVFVFRGSSQVSLPMEQREQLLQDLRGLRQLYKKGIITDSEFQRRRITLYRSLLPYYLR